MKKISMLLVMGLFFIPFLASASFDTNLKYGARTSLVKEVQEFLTEQGVYSGPLTNFFGPLTLKAVKAFQSNQSVSPVSGFWGPLTRTKANAVLATALADSDADEKSQTGTVTDPLQNDPATIQQKQTEELLKKIAELNAKVDAQTQVQQKIADNTTPKAETSLPVVPTVPQPFLKVYGSVITNTIPKDVVNTDMIANKSTDHITFYVKSFNSNGVQVDSDISVITDDPDLPSNFIIKANRGFYLGKHDGGNPQQDCSYDDHDCVPISTGTFTFTFSNQELGVSKTIHLTVIK